MNEVLKRFHLSGNTMDSKLRTNVTKLIVPCEYC